MFSDGIFLISAIFIEFQNQSRLNRKYWKENDFVVMYLFPIDINPKIENSTKKANGYYKSDFARRYSEF